ncbi:hypothetical protein [Bacteroides sp.]|uniref:hypothetical protein n=1 Tax=Bacteroides sp. TaxID=29523 RepID=UPI002A827368|nr:hypothetical protein [Bacteroides sp.]
MVKYLTKLLYYIAKESGSKNDLIDSFKCMVEILKIDNTIFTQVPKSVYVDIAIFDEIENKAGSSVGLIKDLATNKGEKRYNEIECFDKKGVLLFDAMHASAFGHMSYIYRAKGMRLYLFEDNTIGMFTIYSTIDHYGFQYILEDVFDFEAIDTITNEDIERYLSLFDDLEFKDFNQISSNLKFLYMLTHIKQDYKRAYYLEYLLYPPDVDVLSSFSKSIRKTIWDITLSESFEDSYGIDTQKKLINELSYLEIPPFPNQLTDFYKRHIAKRNNEDVFTELANLFHPYDYRDIVDSAQKEQEIIERIKNDYKPLIITEGKTDWKHLKKALIFFKNKGMFLDIDIVFYEYEDEIDMGDSNLNSLLTNMAKLPNAKKIIGIFDCDEGNGKKYASKEFIDFGNNVYAFSIPKPFYRINHTGISIELLYKDSDIKRFDKTERRLYLSSEFNNRGRLIADKSISVENTDRIRKHLEPDNNKIIDSGVTDGENNVALPKNEFALKILNSEEPFDEVDFEGFKGVFEKLNTILSK